MIALPQVAGPLCVSHEFVIASSTFGVGRREKQVRRERAFAECAAASVRRPEVDLNLDVSDHRCPPFACDPSNEVYDRLSALALPFLKPKLFFFPPADSHLSP
jgi:hypothetical protein